MREREAWLAMEIATENEGSVLAVCCSARRPQVPDGGLEEERLDIGAIVESLSGRGTRGLGAEAVIEMSPFIEMSGGKVEEDSTEEVQGLREDLEALMREREAEASAEDRLEKAEGGKQFSCNNCRAKFGRKFSLMRHIQVGQVHSPVRELFPVEGSVRMGNSSTKLLLPIRELVETAAPNLKMSGFWSLA
jgi:hypothetical protein